MFILQAKDKKNEVLSNILLQQPQSVTSEEKTLHPSTSLETPVIAGTSSSQIEEPPRKKLCLNVNEVGVQTVPIKCISPVEDVLKRRVKVLSQRLNRRDAKLKNLQSLLLLLKKKCKNFDEVEQNIKNNFSNIHTLLNTDKSNKGQRYSDEVKKFALSLYFYSSKAYLFVRNRISLPHPVTLRKMIATHECNVGFITEVFEYLKLSIKEYDLYNVALIYDAMSIKSEEVYEKYKDKKWGYIDLAGIITDESDQLATEVLVLQIVSYKRKFKCPIAYFFIAKISAAIQSQLIFTAICMLHDIGITVRSLTSDGTHVNVKTYEQLGCNFSDTDNMTTNFKHPKKDSRIHCIFDPAHMVKLCRNIFAETKLSSPNGDIDFNFLKELHKLQEEEGLKLANKLNANHLNFMGKKMNVKLAAQSLSSSVADAIDFLRTSGNENFQGSEASTEYIRMIDRIFDLLNAKSPIGTGFKSPLRLSNEMFWAKTFSDTREYLKTLTIDDQNILLNRRRMAAFGLIVDTYSCPNLAKDLLDGVDHKLDYFLPYKFSQDHLEMFFSCIRLQGGGNDNPNALQFRYAMRKLLYRNSVTPSINANCTDDDFELSPVLEFRSKKRIIEKNQEDGNSQDENEVEVLFNYMQSINISDYKKNILYYIAGHFVNKMLNKITCQHCRDALIITKDSFDHSYFVDITNFSSFTAFVDRGALKYVSRFAFEVIKSCEQLFMSEMAKKSFRHTSKNVILIMLKQLFVTKLKHLFSPAHPVQSAHDEEPHELQLVKALANSYLNLKIFHQTKLNSLRNFGSKIGLRQKLTKTILFSHV